LRPRPRPDDIVVGGRNYGLPALTLEHVRAYVTEGDYLQLDIG
jgi:hypothetical protein